MKARSSRMSRTGTGSLRRRGSVGNLAHRLGPSDVDEAQAKAFEDVVARDAGRQVHRPPEDDLGAGGRGEPRLPAVR